MIRYFFQQYECSCGSVKFELDLSNHATKGDLKGTIGIVHLHWY